MPVTPPRHNLAALLAALLAVAGSAAAEPQRYRVDAAHSRVEFRIRYLGFFSPGGHFDRVNGIVTFDPEHWETLEVAIDIPLASLESRPAFWRPELLGPRFFDSARFPSMAFHATRAESRGPSSGAAWGSLSLHGVTRPVTLQARVVSHPDEVEIDAETRISRSAFGLGGTLPLAGDEVTVVMHIRAVADAAAPAG